MTTTVIIPTIETERLRLRAPKHSDFETYAAYRTDPTRTSGVGGPANREDAYGHLAEAIGHWHLRGYGRFIIADKTTDAPLGIVGPYYPMDWPAPEIAWSVFAEAEGKGIAYEAAKASRDYAYQTLGWTTAISAITEGNTRSVALAERLGCVREEDYAHPNGFTLQVWRHPGPEALA